MSTVRGLPLWSDTLGLPPTHLPTIWRLRVTRHSTPLGVRGPCGYLPRC